MLLLLSQKNAGLLEKLLESNSVTSVLDKNTVPGVDNKVLTWNTVLKVRITGLPSMFDLTV